MKAGEEEEEERKKKIKQESLLESEFCDSNPLMRLLVSKMQSQRSRSHNQISEEITTT